ncbi:MAG TPA: DUF4058 family protein [Pirellulales bacterium]|nr:DUF4058 family protein [Pirellulales bacterium]
MRIVEDLSPRLPDGCVAEPRVCAFEQQGYRSPSLSPARGPNGGLPIATRAPSAPTLTIDAEFPEQYAYEVLVFDLERERRLVAAIEIVSPANKDRSESRQLFVAKCCNLLRQDVCVSIIDLVTIRQFNLYTDLLAMLERSDPTFTPPPPIYAVTCRKREDGRQTKLDIWSCPLAIGQPLPSLPVWLSETQTVSLDLEASYEETCRVLRIP